MTAKDRNLIIVVLSLIILVVFWFLFYNPMKDKITVIEGEIASSNQILSNLTLEFNKKNQYLEEIENMTSYIDLVDSKFPADITQEMIISSMLKIEREIESLSVTEYSMSLPNIVLSSVENVDETVVASSIKEELQEVKVPLSLEMTYPDLKKMLTYIRNFKTRLSIENLNVASNLETDLVNANFTLNFYALTSEDRLFVPEDFFGPFDPKENSIFMPYDMTLSDSSVLGGSIPAFDEIDLSLNLASSNAEQPSVILFKNNDANSESYLYADNDGNESVEIVFTQTGTTYSFKYKTSLGAYPSAYLEGITFDPGGIIDLGVYSSPRNGVNDLSGVNISLINNTDLSVRIYINDDDLVKPRVNIVQSIGESYIVRD